MVCCLLGLVIVGKGFGVVSMFFMVNRVGVVYIEFDRLRRVSSLVFIVLWGVREEFVDLNIIILFFCFVWFWFGFWCFWDSFVEKCLMLVIFIFCLVLFLFFIL